MCNDTDALRAFCIKKMKKRRISAPLTKNMRHVICSIMSNNDILNFVITHRRYNYAIKYASCNKKKRPFRVPAF